MDLTVIMEKSDLLKFLLKKGNCQDERRTFIGKGIMKIGKLEPLKEKTINGRQRNSCTIFHYRNIKFIDMQPVKAPVMGNFFAEMSLVLAFFMRIQIMVINRQMAGIAL